MGDCASSGVASSPSALARPKSRTLTTPEDITLMLAGLRSRWTMPLSCAAERRIGDLASDGESLVDADASRLDAVRQRRSLHQFQDERGSGARLLNPVDAGDVGMIERRQHACLALESREPIGVRREDAGQDLDRDVASEPRIVCAVHLAHSAGAKRRHDVVVADSIAGGQAGRRTSWPDRLRWTRRAVRPAATRTRPATVPTAAGRRCRPRAALRHRRAAFHRRRPQPRRTRTARTAAVRPRLRTAV